MFINKINVDYFSNKMISMHIHLFVYTLILCVNIFLFYI